MSTIERVRTRAVELGVYLPLGAYTRVRDELADLRSIDLKKTIDGFVERGHERLAPVERRVRRRTEAAKENAAQSARDAEQAVTRTTAKAKAAGRKSAARGKAAAASQAPKVTAAALRPSDLPIDDYASLTVEDVIPNLAGLTQTELTQVRAFEKANQNRSTILDAIDAKMVRLPVPDYDALTAEEIIDRIESLGDEQLKKLRKYEESTRDRITVLQKIDAKLS
jgi:hypothetical protein